MPRVTVGSENGAPIELHYEDSGAGRPVVLVHGWPFSARIWERQVIALVDAGYRAVTYDRRGFGNSSMPWDGYDYDTLTNDLAALLGALNLFDSTLVGFSMGGGEVAHYLGTFGSERVAQAVFVAAVPPGLAKTDENPDGMTDEMVAERQKSLLANRIGFLDEFTKGYFSTAERGLLVSEPTREYYRDIAAFASPRATLQCLASFSRTDFRDDLAKINVPTLIVHGDADANLPLAVSSKRSHDAIAGSELVVIPGAPHGLPITHADELNGILLPFLAR